MMRSMYTAVSGLRTHQGKMDTIGNNIANVNTVGFKRGQVTFKDAFSQTMTGASAPHGGKGGTNPIQIGMGVGLSSIDTIHTIGNGQKTDNPTDLMIAGEGFFTVSDDVNFNNRYYTRAGNFKLDRDGNLVTAEGLKVLGYSADHEGTISESEVGAIRINKSDTAAPHASNKIEFRGNLDSNTPKKGSEIIETIIYDSLGNQYKLGFKVEKTDDLEWKMTLDRITEVATGNYMALEGEDNSNEGENKIFPPTILTFSKEGKLEKISDKDNNSIEEVTLNLEGSQIKFDMDINGNDITEEGNKTSPAGKFDKIPIFSKDNPESYNRITQYANETDLKPYESGGNTSGTLDGFSIDKTGTVVGVFTNGERRALGQLMLTKFDNPMGLEKIGSNMFVDTRNSGEPQYGTAGGKGFGGIDGGTLEMSNVDISYEFTEMITTQRGFQANSRVITTSDEMLQELVNIKR